MAITLGILWFDGGLRDIMIGSRSAFVMPAFIIQSIIILLSMSPLGKIIEFGRDPRMAVNDLDASNNGVQRRSRVSRIAGVVA